MQIHVEISKQINQLQHTKQKCRARKLNAHKVTQKVFKILSVSAWQPIVYRAQQTNKQGFCSVLPVEVFKLSMKTSREY